MRLRNKHIWNVLLVMALLGLFTVVVEMRPGRVYFVLQMLLFQSSVAELMLFLAVLAITIWGQIILLLNNNRVVRWVYLGLLFPFMLVSLSYKFITGYNYSYTDAQTALNNLHSLEAALENFALSVALAFLSAVLLIWLFSKLHRFIRPLYSLKHTWLLLPIIVLGFWYINRTAGVIDDLPAFYRVPLSTYLAASHELPLGQRTNVMLEPANEGAKHIFFIVDESITGSSLSINGNSISTTPYLLAHRDSIVNYGVASAFTNNSAGSQIALMSGARQSQLPDTEHKLLKAPSIFQFAKKAGYKTYYIDSQIGGRSLQNYMSFRDLQSIDHFLQPADSLPDLPYYMRDHWVSDLLIRLAKSDEKVFVYVTKAGAHWPYARTYHPDSTIFKPVLSERSMLKDNIRSRNTYHNSIRWSVDQFWKKLITNIQVPDSTFVLYTSDHGQDLSGDGISIVHASTEETAPIEADVPLWYMDKSGFARTFTEKPATQNQAAQEQIFPSLLLLQGYRPADIQEKYGPTLFDTTTTKRRKFMTGDIFGRGRTNQLYFDVKKQSRLNDRL